MKNYFLLFLLLWTYAAQAQKSKADKSPKAAQKTYLELGLNVTGAIQSFVRNNTDSIYSDPYALSLKFVTHKFGLRLGAGFSTRSSKYITLLQARVDNLERVDLRAGLDYQHPINEHWRVYYGADVLYGTVNGFQQFNDGSKDILTVDVKEKMVGVGPILGVQYHLNKRISFQTEAAFYFLQTNTTKAYTNSSLTNNPLPEKTSRYDFPPGIPRSLSVIVRF
jgi:hypothetical protein